MIMEKVNLMNKNIDEMARDLEDVCENRGCNYENGIRDCDKCRAEWLYELGYRKSTDVAREIFEEIELLLDTYSASHHSIGEVCGESYFERGLEDAIAELKKKHGCEVADNEFN
jgi:hypothetical protein